VGLPRVVHDPDSVAATLLACLPFAKLEHIEGQGEDGCQLLALYDAAGNPVDWPNLESNKLLVRPVFREFFERADMFNRGQRRMPRNTKRDTLVRGIPGIGKSSFALYCLWRLVTQEKRHVLYDYPKGLDASETLVFGSGPRSKCVYIADGLAPRKVAGVRLLVTSPRQEFYEEFKKDARSFFMPELTDEEVLIMRDHCFADCKAVLTDGIVADRLSRWGNVPRMVLGDDATEKAELALTVEGLNEEPLRRLLLHKTETGSKKDMSFRVVHYKFHFDTAAPYRWTPGQQPSRDYSDVKLRWATPYMEDKVWEFLRNSNHESRLALLSEMFKDKAILSFSSSMWEKWCRVALDRGGNKLLGGGFQIRRLSSATVDAAVASKADDLLGLPKGAKMLLPAPPATSSDFSSLVDLKRQLASPPSAALRRFVAPRGFASIDFWEAHLKHPCGSNATVSPVHELIVQGEHLDNGWRAIASSLGLLARDSTGRFNASQQLPLIHLWLVPSVVFAECMAGPLVIAAKKQQKQTNAAGGSVPGSGVAAADGCAAADSAHATSRGKAAAKAAAKSNASQQMQDKQRLAFNEAVKEAHSLEPFIVQYAVLVPTPADWPSADACA
jgi:hypothetical protein